MKYVLGFLIFGIVFLVCSALARVFTIYFNVASFDAKSIYDYAVGIFASCIAGFVGLQTGAAALEKLMPSLSIAKIAWAWVGCAILLWAFSLLGLYTGNDKLPTVIFFTCQILTVVLALRTSDME